MVAKTGVAPVRMAATRHRPRNQLSRGSLNTSSGCSAKCGSSHSLTRIRAGSRLQMRPVSNHASGRLSLTCTSASRSHSSWTSTTHCGSLKPRGFESSGGTSGSGTCMPSRDTMPARVLVPLRPAPATKRTFRGTPSGFISSMALGCSVTAGSLPASCPPPRVLGSSPMKRLFSRAPLLGVVIPAWGVEDYLDDCMRSLVAQTHRRWEAVVVDDGATDRTGEIADAWARRDNRISVVHSVNGGLGAARNLGVQHVRGDYLAFLDSDDVLPPTAYADLVGTLDDSGSDFATGSIVRWEGDRLVEPPWMRRLNRPVRGARVEDRPEVLDEVVYRWRIREGSITQTRASSLQDLADRWETKRRSLASVREHGSAEVETVFVDRVLAGDLWRYFLLVPGCTPEWWRLLRSGVLELWGRRSLVHSGLRPVHRLAGWLVEQDRRPDVTALMEWVAALDGPPPRVQDMTTGAWRLAVPPSVLDETTVVPEAFALRDHEVTS